MLHRARDAALSKIPLRQRGISTDSGRTLRTVGYTWSWSGTIYAQANYRRHGELQLRKKVAIFIR